MNPTFGSFLKQLRKRAGMTQQDLAAATGYSRTLVGAWEQNARLPDINALRQSFVPALGLHDEPHWADQLIELAMMARGERPLSSPFMTAAQTGSRAGATYTLPLLPTKLIGREQELQQLTAHLLRAPGRLLTIVGPPGIGKTRLSLAVGEQVQRYYPDGVVFIPLATVNDAPTMASTILTAVGGGRDMSNKPLRLRLVGWLRHKSMLLILDNFEQLLVPSLAGQAAEFVKELLAECPHLFILITSRERLHLRAEQRYQALPLQVSAAVELFIARASAADAQFAVERVDRTTLEAICQRLDCLPLALELCAAQIELLSPSQLLNQMHSRRLDVLIEGANDLPPRQRTLRAAIAYSYQLLTTEQQTLFRRTGIFEGGFDLAALAHMIDGNVNGDGRQLADDAIPSALLVALRSLIGKSLLQVQTTPGGEQRFTLLETLREFALEELQLHGEMPETRERHFHTYLQLFRTGDGYLRGPNAGPWMARLGLEQDNIRAALRWILHEKRYADAAWIVVPIGFFWFLVGQRYETAGWIKALLPHRQTFPTELHLGLLIVAANAVPPEERTLFVDEMLQLAETCSNPLLQAATWGSVAASLPLNDRAAMFERAIQLIRTSAADAGEPAFGAANDRIFLLSTYLMTYAKFQLTQGEFDQATLLATECLQLNRQQGYQHDTAAGDGNIVALLGWITLARGELREAHQYFQEAISIAETYNYPTMRCEWQPLLALTILYLGNVDEAQRLLHESIAFCLGQQEKLFLARNYTYLTEAALATGAVAEAAQWLAQSFAAHIDPGQITHDEVERLFVAARLATARQEYRLAATLFSVAEAIHSRFHTVFAKPMRALADAALATVQATLEPAAFAEAYAAGQQMRLGDAFAAICTTDHSVAQSAHRRGDRSVNLQ